MSVIDQLGGETTPGAFNKHSQIGDSVSGTIKQAEIVQCRNYTTGQPETWDDGNPKMQVRIIVDVDGEDRGIYVKTWGDGARALKAAVLAAGMSDLDVGAHITATFASTIPSDNPRFNDQKVYTYTLKPASGTATMFAAPPNVDTATGEVTQPAPSNLVDDIKRLASSGLDQKQIVAALGATNPAVNDSIVAAVLAQA